MGTNFYRIPKASDIDHRVDKLMNRILNMSKEPETIQSGFRYIKNTEDTWSMLSPWDEFTKDMRIHLGKRSAGWKFCWNFHNNKYYSNKQELIDFVLNGRIVDEYGQEHNPQEFLDMAFEWCQPDGLIGDRGYFEKKERYHSINMEHHFDHVIDGLRVSSSTEFS